MAITRAEYNFADVVSTTTCAFPLFELKSRVNEEDEFTAVDLTGATVRIWFRDRANDGYVFLKKDTSVGGGITLIDATAGKFQIDEFKVMLRPGTYHYDIKIIFPDNTEKIYQYGTMTVLQNVTK